MNTFKKLEQLYLKQDILAPRSGRKPLGTKMSRKRSLFTGADSDNLDGDFKALKEIQKKRNEERSKLRAAQKQKGSSPRHETHITIPRQEQKVEAKEDAEIKSLCQALFEAAEKDKESKFKQEMDRVDSKALSLVDKCFRKSTGETVLHSALLKDADLIANYLLTNGELGLILSDFEVVVRKVPSRKTCLHILAEKGNMGMIETLIHRLPSGEKKLKYLLKTVLKEVEGQRPRHLSAIHIAALYGHTELVQYLVNLGVDVNLVNNKQDTPVLWAARFNHIGTVRTLIKLGADLHHQNDKGSTPLYWAVRYGLAEMTELLLKEGKADVHQQRKLGLVSPIVLGSAMGFTDIVQMLLDAGAHVNLRIQGGNTPLHLAASQGNIDTIHLLLKYKAEIDAENDFGDTPLLMAATELEIEAMEVLADKGADLDNTDKDGRSVWDYVIESSDPTLLTRWVICYQSARQLAENELVVPKGNKTPLHISAKIGDCDKLRTLLDLGADPKALDEAGNAFFHLAARENRVTVLETFMDQININMQNTDGDTALHLAVRFGHIEAVTLLLKKMKINVTNSLGETALHVACKTRSVPAEIVEFLVDTIVKAHTWDLVDASDKKGNTGLHAATKAGRADILGSLTQLNPRRKNHTGDTPLHVAARAGEVNVLQQLIELFRQDIDLNAQNEHGETALHLAAAGGNEIMVEVFIEAGASLEIQNQDGDTVLHALVIHSTLDTMRTQAYVAVLETVVDKAARWWCMKKDLHLPDPESDPYQVYRREALLQLIRDIPNKNGFSVMALAAKVGAKDILQTILGISEVFIIANETSFVFDVTSLAPESMSREAESKKASKKNLRKKSAATIGVETAAVNEDPLVSHMTSQSCLDLILASSDIHAANEMLDVTPIKQIVADYWAAYQWIYGVLMIVHVVFMSCLSHFTPSLVSTSSTDSLDLSLACFLIWPGVLLLYEIYYIIARIIRFVHKQDGSKPFTWLGLTDFVLSIFGFIMNHLAHFASFAFSVVMMTWFTLYVTGSPSQAHALALALVIGWMFSIFFTQGFERVHAFTIMLKNIIIRDISRFFILYLFVFLGFSFAFQALLYLVPDLVKEFPSIWHIYFITFNMMIGMDSFFEMDTFEDAHDTAGHSSIWVKLVYLVYVILTTIILLNLLIAMMNDSYTEVKAKEGTTWRVGSIKLALLIEKAMPFVPRFLKAIRIKQNKITWDDKNKRWLLVVPRSHVEVKEQRASSEVIRTLNKFGRELQEVKNMYNVLNDRLGAMLEHSYNMHEDGGRPMSARPGLKSRFSSSQLLLQSRRKSHVGAIYENKVSS